MRRDRCCPSHGPSSQTSTEFLRDLREHVPAGETREGKDKALSLPEACPAEKASLLLGNGSKISAVDTVPFCLWIVAQHLRASYEEAFWAPVSALGDRDTTCAIVGGILAVRTDCSALRGIPEAWLSSSEALPLAFHTT